METHSAMQCRLQTVVHDALNGLFSDTSEAYGEVCLWDRKFSGVAEDCPYSETYLWWIEISRIFETCLVASGAHQSSKFGRRKDNSRSPTYCHSLEQNLYSDYSIGAGEMQALAHTLGIEKGKTSIGMLRAHRRHNRDNTMHKYTVVGWSRCFPYTAVWSVWCKVFQRRHGKMTT